MSSKTTSLLMLAGGIAVGATLGLLLAPRSGKDTRKAIAKQGRKLRGKITDLAAKGADLAEEMNGKVKAKATS